MADSPAPSGFSNGEMSEAAFLVSTFPEQTYDDSLATKSALRSALHVRDVSKGHREPLTMDATHSQPTSPRRQITPTPVGVLAPPVYSERSGALTAPPGPVELGGATQVMQTQRPGTSAGVRQSMSNRVSPNSEHDLGFLWNGPNRDANEQPLQLSARTEHETIHFDWEAGATRGPTPTRGVTPAPFANVAPVVTPDYVVRPRIHDTHSMVQQSAPLFDGSNSLLPGVGAGVTQPAQPVGIAVSGQSGAGNEMMSRLRDQARSVKAGVASSVAAIGPALGLAARGGGEGRGQSLSAMLAPKRTGYNDMTMGRRSRRMDADARSKEENLQVKQMLIRRLRDLHKTGVQLSIDEDSFNVASTATLEWELKSAVSTLRSDSRAQFYTSITIHVARTVTVTNNILGFGLPGMNTYVHKVAAFMNKPLSRYNMHQLVAMMDNSVTHPLWYFGMGMGLPLVLSLGAKAFVFAVGYMTSDYKARLVEKVFFDSDQTPNMGAHTSPKQPKHDVEYDYDDDDDDDLAPPSDPTNGSAVPPSAGSTSASLGVRDWEQS